LDINGNSDLAKDDGGFCVADGGGVCGVGHAQTMPPSLISCKPFFNLFSLSPPALIPQGETEGRN